MRKRRNVFALGMTAIVVFGLFIFTVLFLNPIADRPTYRVVVEFRHSEGLAPIRAGSPVLLSGAVQIGTVDSVRPEEILVAIPGSTSKVKDLFIIVNAQIDTGITLYADAQITTDQPAVGGVASMVVLDVGTKGAPLTDATRIKGLAPQSLAATIGALSRRLLGPGGMVDKLDTLIDPNTEGSAAFRVLKSLADVNDMTARLRVQFDAAESHSILNRVNSVASDLAAISAALREELAGTRSGNLLAKVHQSLDALSAALVELNDLLRDNRAPVASVMTNVEELARVLNSQLGALLRAELNRDDPTSMLGKLHLSMDRVNESLGDVTAATDAARRTVEFSRPALERTLVNVKEMSNQLRLASEEIRLSPWRLMYRPTPSETGRITVFEAARTFAEAATFLDDAAARLEAAASAGAGSDAELAEVRKSVREAFDRFKLAEEYLWEKLK